MSIRILILLILICFSCNYTEKKEKSSSKSIIMANSDNRQERTMLFSKSKNIENLFSKTGSSIPFSLTYNKDSCIVFNNICFYKLSLMLKSDEYLKSSIYLGMKSDSLFVGEFYDSKINATLFLFSMNDYSFPREIKNTFLLPRTLDIKNVYNDKISKEEVFQIESFYDLPHSKSPEFTFYQFYMSKERGIFRVDVIDENTKEVYSNVQN